MLAVAIPAPLALIDGGPQVVPVDGDGHSQQFLSVALVGQRVALAWRETCPTCEGTGIGSVTAGQCIDIDGYWWHDPAVRCSGCTACPRCTNGERMVVGWTAEVEAVVPIHDMHDLRFDLVSSLEVIPERNEMTLFIGEMWDMVDTDLSHLLPLADWSPGRYALVLRDVVGDTFFGDHDRPAPCRLFDGFADLTDILKERP